MRRLILFFSIFCSVAVAAQTPVDSLEAQPYYILIGEAEEALADDRLSDAAARLREAMQVDPDNPGNVLLLSNLGVNYWRCNEDSLALDVLNEANRRAPSMVTVLLNRGRLLLDMGHNREAYEDFNEVVALDSANCPARYYRGTMSLYGGRLDMAEKDFDVLKKLKPKALDTAVALSALYSLSGRDREAVPYFERLVEEDPAPEYFAGLAGCLLALQDYTRAAEVIEGGLKRYSHDPELYYYRAWLNRDRYRLDDARSDAAKAVEYGASKTKVDALFAR
ncbi:MAG: tetratricopeptide repeat protein [Muribaculaceae bacterium]|nr:tetratricopeptide repeat protein [Muribaculaceae bacterium]